MGLELNLAAPQLYRTDFQIDDWPLKTTRWHLLFKNDLISLKRLPLIPLLFSLYMWPSCQALSNALDRSRKTPRTSNKGLASEAQNILCVIAICWCMQGSLGQDPDWMLLKRLFLSMKPWIMSKISFSKILEQMGKRHWTRAIYDLRRVLYFVLELYYLISNHLEKLLAEGNFYI